MRRYEAPGLVPGVDVHDRIIRDEPSNSLVFMGSDAAFETIKQTLHTEALQEQQLMFQEQNVKDRLTQTYKINLDEILSNAQEQFGEINFEEVNKCFFQYKRDPSIKVYRKNWK